MKKKIFVSGLLIAVIALFALFNVSTTKASCTGSGCTSNVTVGASSTSSSITISGTFSSGYNVQTVTCDNTLGLSPPLDIFESGGYLSYTIDGVSGSIPSSNITITQTAYNSSYNNCGTSDHPEQGTYSFTLNSNPYPGYAPWGSVTYLSDGTASFGSPSTTLNDSFVSPLSPSMPTQMNTSQVSGPYIFTIKNTSTGATPNWVSDQKSISKSSDCGATDGLYSCPTTLGDTCTATITNYSSTIKLKDITGGFSSSPNPIPYSQTTTQTCKYNSQSCLGSCSSSGSFNCSANASNCGMCGGSWNGLANSCTVNGSVGCGTSSNVCQAGCGGTWNSNTNCSAVYTESTSGSADVASNATTTFSLSSLTAPSAAKTYTEIWQMFNGSTAFGPQIPFTIIVGTMSGTMSATACTVPANSGSGTVNLTWNVTNPEVPNGSAITSSGVNVFLGDSGTSVPTTVPYAGKTFYLYNNAKSLVPTSPNGSGLTVNCTCAANTTWNGTICSPNQEALTVTPAGTGTGTVTSSPAGISCGADCSQSYNYNTAVVLTATPTTGSTFTGWTGACTGTGTCSLTMTAAKAVTATFTLNTYTVTPSAGTGGTISPNNAQVVNYGSTKAFTLTPSTGYSIGTTTGTCPAGTLSGSTYTTGAITANCTVIANFTINTYNVTPSAGTGGTISPNNAQVVNYGSTKAFTLTASTGYSIGTTTGTCPAGTLSGSTYTTGAITANCTVIANFTINTYTVTPSAGTGGNNFSK